MIRARMRFDDPEIPNWLIQSRPHRLDLKLTRRRDQDVQLLYRQLSDSPLATTIWEAVSPILARPMWRSKSCAPRCIACPRKHVV